MVRWARSFCVAPGAKGCGSGEDVPMNDYMAQHQAMMQQRQQQRLQRQAQDQERLQGIADGRAQMASVREITKIQKPANWGGLQVLVVVSSVILMFLYNSVFKDDKRLFWVFTVVLVVLLIYKFVDLVRNDGAHVASGLL